MIFRMLCVTSHTSSAVSQDDSHVSVSREVCVGKFSLLFAVLLFGIDGQAKHFIGQLERLVGGLGGRLFNANRVIERTGSIVAQSRLVLGALVAVKERHTQLTLYDAGGGLGTWWTCVRW